MAFYSLSFYPSLQVNVSHVLVLSQLISFFIHLCSDFNNEGRKVRCIDEINTTIYYRDILTVTWPKSHGLASTATFNTLPHPCAPLSKHSNPDHCIVHTCLELVAYHVVFPMPRKLLVMSTTASLPQQPPLHIMPLVPLVPSTSRWGNKSCEGLGLAVPANNSLVCPPLLWWGNL